MTETDTDELVTFLDDGERPKGMSPLQYKYAQCRLLGYNQVTSAELAGYGGDRSTLAATASRVEHSKVVRNYMEQAAERDNASEQGNLTMDECLERLSTMARTGLAKPNELKALEVLIRHNLLLQERLEEMTSAQLLDNFCKDERDDMPPFLSAYALILWSRHFSNTPGTKDWKLPEANAARLGQHPDLLELASHYVPQSHLALFSSPTKGNGITQSPPGNGRTRYHA